ncbi:MAG: ribosomal-processing cysteine protease Prp [Spirochaetaceae bacterium]|nr:ribosomal-processing cysteine protease Prp [Spirochaetaceae bacterium]
MIAAKAVLDAEGRLVRFEAEGHAGSGPKGRDLVCAAFSVLARSAYEALAGLPGVELEGSAPDRGSLRFRVRSFGPGSEGRAAGIADFLLAGISGLEREYPGEVGLTIERYWRE